MATIPNVNSLFWTKVNFFSFKPGLCGFIWNSEGFLKSINNCPLLEITSQNRRLLWKQIRHLQRHLASYLKCFFSFWIIFGQRQSLMTFFDLLRNYLCWPLLAFYDLKKQCLSRWQYVWSFTNDVSRKKIATPSTSLAVLYLSNLRSLRDVNSMSTIAEEGRNCILSMKPSKPLYFIVRTFVRHQKNRRCE